jgi:hypothetical protein
MNRLVERRRPAVMSIDLEPNEIEIEGEMISTL